MAVLNRSGLGDETAMARAVRPGSDAYGRCGGGCAESRGRSWCSCEREIHAAVCGASFSADTVVSYLKFFFATATAALTADRRMPRKPERGRITANFRVSTR